jgi:hypothetical protein
MADDRGRVQPVPSGILRSEIEHGERDSARCSAPWPFCRFTNETPRTAARGASSASGNERNAFWRCDGFPAQQTSPGEIPDGFSDFFLDGARGAIQFIRRSEGSAWDGVPSETLRSFHFFRGFGCGSSEGCILSNGEGTFVRNGSGRSPGVRSSGKNELTPIFPP